MQYIYEEDEYKPRFVLFLNSHGAMELEVIYFARLNSIFKKLQN